MTRRDWLTGALAQASPSAGRPNIILILADDLAAWMLGCYGNQEIHTPNIDRLAAHGVRFENSFVCTPICSASRATLFTGRTPLQHGIHDFLTPRPIDQPPQGQAAPPASFRSEVFLSDLLAAAGYTCGYNGKWHLGAEETPQHGFRHWHIMAGGGSSRYQDPVMFSNLAGGDARRVEEKGYLTDRIHGGAIDFIERARKEPNPWFCVVSHFNPHTPLDGHPQKYYDLYQSADFKTFPIEPAKPNALRERNLLGDPIGNLRKTAASVTALDDRVGALIDYLDDRKLSRSTVVFFAGDNGFLLGRHGYWSKGLASDPINMYEEVMRVPLIARWLERIPSGRTRPEMVSFYDFLPTVLELAGLPPPDRRRNLCGRSYWPLMTTRALGGWDNRVFGYFRNTAMIRDTRHKLVRRNDGKGPNELWDLETDPTEHTNRIDDPALRSLRQRLARDLASWIKRYSA